MFYLPLPSDQADRLASEPTASDFFPTASLLEAAAVLFVGSVQGLVMQSLLAGDVQLIRREAPGVFALFRRAVAVRP